MSSALNKPSNPDVVKLTVGGRAFMGWTSIRVSRGLDRMVTDFHLQVTERWAGQDQPWQIEVFDSCTVSIGSDVILTGYVDDYLPSFDAQQHGVSITGRSKTQDITDCTPNIASGQFAGYKLDAIARAIAQQFGIEVVTDTDVGDPFPDATIQRSETGFEFLERLCRLRSVLATDDEQGRLVLTTAGSATASGALVQGENILAAHGRLSGSQRFSEFRVKGQHDETPSQLWPDAETDGDADLPETSIQNQVVTDFEAVAYDTGVPRYRPKTTMAEAALDAKGAQLRADWEARYSAARGTQAHVVVPGWRQPNGKLWRTNQLVSTTIPYMQLDRDLLVASVTFMLSSEKGTTTELMLGPVEAYTPDPGQVKVRKNRAKRGTGADPWNGLGSTLYINPNAAGPGGAE